MGIGKKSAASEKEAVQKANQIMMGFEEAGHSHQVADYLISRSALEELLVAFADKLTAEQAAELQSQSKEGLIEILRHVADHIKESK